MRISPAREAAFDVLFRIETERAFSSILLPAFENNLSPADGALCHELVLGTLRRQIYLDRVIDLLGGAKKLDIEVRLALRLGLYQLRFLDKIPQYSAINESVNLTARARKTSAKGLVNAVLRSSLRRPPVLTFSDPTDELSVNTSHPRWLIGKWISDFGELEAASLAMANNEIPGAAFRLTGASASDVERILPTAQLSNYVEGCYISERIDAEIKRLAAEGKIYLQDEASQMAAVAVSIPEGASFLDVCAAPGGKTGLIASRATDRNTLVVAGDFHSSRVEYLRENCRRQGVSHVAVVQYDAEKGLPFEAGTFDRVLVDAPCSGTGTIRSNPEIRYFLSPSDLGELPLKQLSILKNASNVLNSGGMLVYSTCSLEREENEAVCRRFLSERPNFRVANPAVPEVFLTDEGTARTWPHRNHMDGFFIAGFRRD